MARFRERATAGDRRGAGGKRGTESRFPRFIPRIWIHSAGQPANRSGHLSNARIFIRFLATNAVSGRKEIPSSASIEARK